MNQKEREAMEKDMNLENDKLEGIMAIQFYEFLTN